MLDSCDHGYVLLFVADHCESSCLICLQARSIKLQIKIPLKICSWRYFELVGTSDPLVETSDLCHVSMLHFVGTSD